MSEPVAKLVPVNDPVQTDLYEVRRTIYPRAVHGWFANWRWSLVFLTQAVFYGLPWLTINGRQAVLFDLGSRKFYVFGHVFWPQDFIFLTALQDQIYEETALSTGAVDYVEKSRSFGILLARISLIRGAGKLPGSGESEDERHAAGFRLIAPIGVRARDAV